MNRTIFEIWSEAGYELCQPVVQPDWNRMVGDFNGEARLATWSALRVRLIRLDDAGMPLQRSAAPWLAHNVLMLRPAAVDAIRDLIAQDIQFLPLECSDENFLAVNVLRVRDALDESKSAVNKLRSGVRLPIARHVFLAERLGPEVIFKLEGWRASAIYVDQRFVDCWALHGLSGLRFKRVWNAEDLPCGLRPTQQP